MAITVAHLWIFVALKQLSDDSNPQATRTLVSQSDKNRLYFSEKYIFFDRNDVFLRIFVKMCKLGTNILNHTWSNTIICISPLQGTYWSHLYHIIGGF